MVTQHQEDYLRAIYLLQLKGTPLLTETAKYLKVSKASASQMVKTLAKDGYLRHRPYAPLALTAKGARLGKELTYKHRLIESFLTTILKMPASKVHEEAHRLEHAFSDEAIARMSQVLGNPRRDPHGQPLKA